MKKWTSLILLTLLTFSAWTQSVDLSRVTADDIMNMEIEDVVDILDEIDMADVPAGLVQQLMAQVDLSDVDVYFQGPVDFLLKGIEVDGKNYAAILEYDGANTFTIAIPEYTNADMKPMMLDVSEVDFKLPTTAGGYVSIEGVILDDLYGEVDVRLDLEDLAFVADQALTFTGVKADADAKRAKIDQLESEIEDLEAKLAKAESGDTAEIKAQLEELQAKYDAGEEEYYEMKDELEELQAKYDEGYKIYKEGEKEYYRMKRELEACKAGKAMVDAEGARTVFIDLSTAMHYGNWTATETGITMTDSDALFAKYAVAMTQDMDELFYNFTVEAKSDKGWVGAGTHILGSDVQALGRYGFGESYLVWLTRDNRNQTQDTFVELYHSTTDSRMVEVARKKIDNAMTKANDVSVYVNKNNNMIVVSVNGEEIISYEADMLPDGDVAAVRALGGPVSFTNISAKAR